MNNIQSRFSIKDLENLSGIKAHTIRIWEKRYALFKPNRTETNIRYYSVESLQKLLNISYLNNNGYKISKISNLETKQIPLLVKEISKSKDLNNHAINAFKLSMLDFDQSLFYSTFEELIKKHSFRKVFYDVIVPFLDEIGLLWQTNTITPAHEHFIVELIKQKILIYTEKAITNSSVTNKEKTYVLFLPENEIHELGLLFTNYELTNKGYHCIYLGQSVPIDSLKFLVSKYDNITFISSFTVKPEKDGIDNYIDEIKKEILKNTKNSFIVSGRLTSFIDLSKVTKQINVFKSTKEIIDTL